MLEFEKLFPFASADGSTPVCFNDYRSYYSLIGGWVIKYLFEYLKGNSAALAADDYFSNFIASSGAAELWFLIFSALVFIVILAGVKNGVELVSKIMMPVLVLLAVFVAGYSVTRPGAMEGVKYFLIPNFENFSPMTVVAAMGQMFYSLSIAKGYHFIPMVLIWEKDRILKHLPSRWRFLTAIGLLAGLMIIPAVFAFSGGAPETLQAGPSLMFITLPKVFASMGFGGIAGFTFFLLVLLAALTSAISLMETSVSTISDELGWNRKKSCIIMAVVMLSIGSASAFGYGIWDFVTIFGMQILDFVDFLTNSVMMPIAALATCFLILKVVGLQTISEEIERSSKFKRKKLYSFFVRNILHRFALPLFF